MVLCFSLSPPFNTHFKMRPRYHINYSILALHQSSAANANVVHLCSVSSPTIQEINYYITCCVEVLSCCGSHCRPTMYMTKMSVTWWTSYCLAMMTRCISFLGFFAMSWSNSIIYMPLYAISVQKEPEELLGQNLLRLAKTTSQSAAYWNWFSSWMHLQSLARPGSQRQGDWLRRLNNLLFVHI